jgi:hypothetical protein
MAAKLGDTHSALRNSDCSVFSCLKASVIVPVVMVMVAAELEEKSWGWRRSRLNRFRGQIILNLNTLLHLKYIIYAAPIHLSRNIVFCWN